MTEPGHIAEGNTIRELIDIEAPYRRRLRVLPAAAAREKWAIGDDSHTQ